MKDSYDQARQAGWDAAIAAAATLAEKEAETYRLCESGTSNEASDYVLQNIAADIRALAIVKESEEPD